MLLVLFILLNEMRTIGDGITLSLEWKVYKQVISMCSKFS